MSANYNEQNDKNLVQGDRCEHEGDKSSKRVAPKGKFNIVNITRNIFGNREKKHKAEGSRMEESVLSNVQNDSISPQETSEKEVICKMCELPCNIAADAHHECVNKNLEINRMLSIEGLEVKEELNSLEEKKKTLEEHYKRTENMMSKSIENLSDNMQRVISEKEELTHKYQDEAGDISKKIEILQAQQLWLLQLTSDMNLESKSTASDRLETEIRQTKIDVSEMTISLPRFEPINVMGGHLNFIYLTKTSDTQNMTDEERLQEKTMVYSSDQTTNNGIYDKYNEADEYETETRSSQPSGKRAVVTPPSTSTTEADSGRTRISTKSSSSNHSELSQASNASSNSGRTYQPVQQSKGTAIVMPPSTSTTETDSGQTRISTKSSSSNHSELSQASNVSSDSGRTYQPIEGSHITGSETDKAATGRSFGHSGEDDLNKNTLLLEDGRVKKIPPPHRPSVCSSDKTFTLTF